VALFPYPVVFANKAWTNITEYEQHEVVGDSLKKLQGPMTNLGAIKDMMHSIRETGSGECHVVNYTKSGNPYFAKVIVHPSVYPRNISFFSFSFSFFVLFLFLSL
jgi:hypothetical protein